MTSPAVRTVALPLGERIPNLDVPDLEDLYRLPSEGPHVQTDQVLYNLTRRGVELGVQPWCRARGVPLMAYSPLEQGRLLGSPALRRVAERHGATPAQAALAWVLRHEDVCAIPKASTTAHVEGTRAALELRLTRQDLAELDRAFPPPAEEQPLEMI